MSFCSFSVSSMPPPATENIDIIDFESTKRWSHFDQFMASSLIALAGSLVSVQAWIARGGSVPWIARGGRVHGITAPMSRSKTWHSSSDRSSRSIFLLPFLSHFLASILSKKLGDFQRLPAAPPLPALSIIASRHYSLHSCSGALLLLVHALFHHNSDIPAPFLRRQTALILSIKKVERLISIRKGTIKFQCLK